MAKSIFAILLALFVPGVGVAQLNVITSGGFFVAYQELLPRFEKNFGISVTTRRGPSQGSGSDTISGQLQRGVVADVVIMTRAGLNELIGHGNIAPGTDVDLAGAPLGIAVRAGATVPDISSVGAVKQALLRAKSVAYESSTVPYMRKALLPRLEIADAVIPKSIEAGAPAVANGAAELVIAPVSELIHAPGVHYIGTLPSEIQLVMTFSAAIVVGSRNLDAAHMLIAFLSSPEARPAISHSGMEPLH